QSAGKIRMLAEHFRPDLIADPRCQGIRARATLFQRDESEARWNDPTRTPGHPRPPKFVRVEPNLAVNQLEFPAPQPVALPATCAKKPLSRFVASSMIVAAQDINGRERQ